MKKGVVAARVVVAIVVLGTLFSLPTGLVPNTQALTWHQTSRTDFEAGTAWNVETEGGPGDVTLIPSPTDWIKDAANPIFEGQAAWDFTSVGPGSVHEEGGGYRMWFEGIGGGVGAVGVATSPDGRTWTENPSNPVLAATLPWQGGDVLEPSVVREANGTYTMWFRGGQTGTAQIGKAWSPDGIAWSPKPTPVLTATEAWESEGVFQPSVLIDGGTYRMWYTAFDRSTLRIGYAESIDGESWVKSPFNPLGISGRAGSWNLAVGHPHVVRELSEYRMWYTGCSTASCTGSEARIGLATSADGLAWVNDPNNPAVGPAPSGWESWNVIAPAVYRARGAHQTLYSGCESVSGRCRLGLANAAYASRFVKAPTNPLLAEGPAGSWDDFAIEGFDMEAVGGFLHAWYSGRSTPAPNSVGRASSPDGLSWVRHPGNPVIPGDAQSDLEDLSIVQNGAGYSMYHERRHNARGAVFLATSPDGNAWNLSENDPVLEISPGSWDETSVRHPHVLFDGSSYTMWYTGESATGYRIGLATSEDGVNWVKPDLGDGTNRVGLDLGPEDQQRDAVVVWDGAMYRIWYGCRVVSYQVCHATSPDGVTWTKSSVNPVLAVGPTASWDSSDVFPQVVRYDVGMWRMWYSGYGPGRSGIGHAFSRDGVNWTRSGDPVFGGAPAPAWDAYAPDLPYVVRVGPEFWMYYRAADAPAGTYQIGRARSADGVSWTRDPASPALIAGTDWERELVHGAVVPSASGSGFDMLYTALPTSSTRQIGLANSPDGVTWTRRSPSDPVLGLGSPGQWDDGSVYAASVLLKGGEYRMWYGGGSTNTLYQGIGYATSRDGTNWTRNPGNPVLQAGDVGTFEEEGVHPGQVIRWGPIYVMAYLGLQDSTLRVGLATSVDGVTWTLNRLNPMLSQGHPLNWDGGGISSVAIAQSDVLNLWYGAGDGTNSVHQIGYASANPRFIGTLESQVFDSGAAGTIWESLSWGATLPADTYLSFAARGGDAPDLTAVPWGPEISTSGSPLALPRSRYVQHRATLVSLSGVDSPVLHEVSVEYEQDTASAPLPQSPDDMTWTANPRPTFTWTFQDLEGDSQTAFRVEIDWDEGFPSIDYTSGDVVSSAGSWPSFPLPDGCWYWRVGTRESFGVWSPFGGGRRVCIDTVAPTVTLAISGSTHLSGGDTYVRSSNLFSLSATDAGIGVHSISYRTWNGTAWSAWASYATPFALTGPDGRKHIEYFATDKIANLAATVNASFVLDDSPPVTTFTVGAPSVEIDGTFHISSGTLLTLSASDGGSKVRSTSLRVGTEPWRPYIGPFTLGGYSGLLTVSYRSEDHLSNTESVGSTLILIDDAPPITSAVVIGPSAEVGGTLYIRSATSIGLTASDASTGVDGVLYAVDAGGLTPYSAPFTVGGEGAHAITFFATDLLGNAETPVGMSFVVDDTAPTTLLTIEGPTAGTNPTYVDATSQFLLTSEDGASGIGGTSYQVGGSPATPYDGPFSLAGLPDGPHELSYSTTDRLGNEGTIGTTSVYLDTMPPVANAGPDVATTKGTSVTVDGSESVDTGGITNYTWRMTRDATTIVAHGATAAFTFPIVGSFIATLTVRDRLGHESTDSLVVTVGTARPTARLLASPGAGNLDTRFEFDARNSVDADGTIASWAWDFGDGETAAGATATHTFRTRGSFVVTLTVTDDDGAMDTTSLTLTVRNRAPTANAGPDQSTVSGEVVELLSTGAQDPDGDPLTFAWRQVDGPAVTLTAADTATATFRPDQAGVYTFELVVDDGLGGIATDRIVVHVSQVAARASVVPWLGIFVVAIAIVMAALFLARRKKGSTDTRPEETVTRKSDPQAADDDWVEDEL